MRKEYGTTIQLWPGGQSVTYKGDVHGPDFRVRGKNGRWRKATCELTLKVRREQLAEMYAERDILCCDSSLVDALLQASFDGFSWDDVENIYVDPADWTIAQCRKWIDDEGHDPPELDDDADEGDWRDVVRDLSSDNPQEVYEWYRVSSWLCDNLRALGEVVLDNDCGTWWGRGCTGQRLIMDGTLQAVAARYAT